MIRRALMLIARVLAGLVVVPFLLASPALVLPAAAAPAPGLEIQAYPAGLISTARLTWPLGSRDALILTAGWNLTDRRDWGRHDDEQGGGPGAGLAWWRWQRPDRTGWGFGARTDIWRLDIDWEDPGVSGTSNVIVAQPAARLGWSWNVGDGGAWRVEATVSAGVEINVSTDGEEVGEGAILLGGASLSRSI